MYEIPRKGSKNPRQKIYYGAKKWQKKVEQKDIARPSLEDYVFLILTNRRFIHYILCISL